MIKKFEAEFIQAVKGQNIFLLKECFFNLFLEVFSDPINWNNYNSNWKKLLGFRNMQEKLEKYIYSSPESGPLAVP